MASPTQSSTNVLTHNPTTAGLAPAFFGGRAFLFFLQRTPYPIVPPTIAAMFMPTCYGLSRYRKIQVAQGDGRRPGLS